MKNALLLFAALFIATFSFAQTIRRVTNLPVTNLGVNVYTNVNDAIAAAANGDIIYIEPSTTAYPGFTVTKTLNFIGNGNFLDQNSNTPLNKTNSIISGQVTFNAGSNNSTISGIYFDNYLDITNASGLQIKKNRFSSRILLGENTSGILISENYVNSYLSGNGSCSSCGLNSVIKNNIIDGYIAYFKNSTIQNNTLRITQASFNSIIHSNVASVITNNLLDLRQFNSIYDVTDANSGSTVSNNFHIVGSGATLPSPNPDLKKNVYSKDDINIFVVANPWFSNPRKDADFKLKNESPAKGIGIDGVDAGAYGGSFPYTLSGLPNIPIITSAVSSVTGTNTVPLNVTISVRSN